MSIDLIQHPETPQIVSDSTTVDSLFARDLVQGAIEKGYNINKLLLSVGISPWLLNDPKGRITFRQLADLSISLSDLMNDEYFGLTEKPQRQGTFKFMCYSALIADTAYEAMAIFCQYMNLYENTWSHKLTSTNSLLSYQAIARSGFQLAHPIALEYLFSTLYRTLCWMTNSQLPLSGVSLPIPKPKFPARYRFMFYNAKITFSQEQASLNFPADALNVEVVRDKRDVKEFLKTTHLALLTQTIPVEDITSRTRTFLERQLMRENSLPSIEHTSQHLGLHPQALRRKLAKENTSFNDIKIETRRDLAISMINNTNYRVAEISEKLNFSEPSAFVRAFKQWTGFTPKSYQARL